MSAEASTRPRVVTISPGSAGLGSRLRELAEFRELLYFLVWRDVKVRYKQTALGAAWAVLQPVTTTVVFALFFGRLAHVPSEGVPYALFALSGLVLWTFFSQALSQGSQSLVSGGALISKLYFPRLLVPLAAVTSFLVDLAIGIGIVLIATAAYGRGFGVRLMALPLFALLACVIALGVSFALAALNVRYRDVRYVLPFVVQLWLFCSPVAYPSTLLSGTARTFYGINPMAGTIDGFRWSVLGTPPPPAGQLAVSCVSAVLLAAAGLLYFTRMERTFADEI